MANLVETVTCLVHVEYDSVIEINKDRNVSNGYRLYCLSFVAAEQRCHLHMWSDGRATTHDCFNSRVG